MGQDPSGEVPMKPARDRTVNYVGIFVLALIGSAAFAYYSSQLPMSLPVERNTDVVVKEEVLPSVDDSATLTLGRLSHGTRFSNQQMTIHNNLNTTIKMLTVECGAFKGGMLVDTEHEFIHDIQPNSDGFTGTLFIHEVPDLVRCRISDIDRSPRQ